MKLLTSCNIMKILHDDDHVSHMVFHDDHDYVSKFDDITNVTMLRHDHDHDV